MQQQSKEQLTEMSLSVYKLVVTRRTSSAISKEVTLMHFAGFEDCEAPEVQGFAIVMETLMRHYASQKGKNS